MTVTRDRPPPCPSPSRGEGTSPDSPSPLEGEGQGGEYLKDADAIYAKSFAIIRAEADLSRFAGAMEAVALRVIHACGDPAIAPDLVFSSGAAEAGSEALAKRATILVDASMVAHGVVPVHLPVNNRVVCTLHDQRVAPRAKRLGMTRSAAAVDLWDEWLPGAVVAIGNAPTALFHLLERIKDGAAKPALILGFAVGFVGAAESKAALIASGLPYIALKGRRGGSAMAAAAVNALGRVARGLNP
jgi:precorrin-8X/cobalt-precorrin-8 methylmutase